MSARTCFLFHFLALVAVLCVWPISRAQADPDPFAGTHSVVTAYDDHMWDGLSLTLGTVSVDLATSDQVTYLMTPPGATMTRSGGQLTLNPRPQSFGSTLALNSYVLAGGTFGTAVYMGQQAADPSDLSIRVAMWGEGVAVTSAQLAGLWQGTLIYDNDLADDPSAPFLVANSTFTVSDLGSNQILLDFGGGMTMNAIINGTVIEATDPNFNYFRMITDGGRFIVAALNQEELAGAPGNISGGIAIATLIPEPVTAALLVGGGLALLRRRRRW